MRIIASPAFLILYAVVSMWLLLDVHIKEISSGRRWAGSILFVVILAGNLLARAYMEQALYGKLALFIMQLPLYLLFCILSRHRGIKLLFVMLSAIAFATPTVVLTQVFVALFSLTRTGILCANLLAYFLVILFVWKCLKAPFNYILDYAGNRVFWMFSLIPLLFYVYGYLKTGYVFLPAEIDYNFLINRIPAFIVYVSYILLLYIFRNTRETNRMQNERNLMAMQLEAADRQLAEFSRSQAVTATYRHDLRHHFAMLNDFLKSGDTASALQYISTAEGDIEKITPTRYCENTSVNLILSSFADRARRRGVNLSAEADIPQSPGLSDTELCALLSNGLENAVEAAASCTGQRERLVRVNCQTHKGKLLIFIKNPCDGQVVMKDGLPQSNRSGHGFGTKSISSIVESRGGVVSFEAAGGVFTLKIMLPMVENCDN